MKYTEMFKNYTISASWFGNKKPLRRFQRYGSECLKWLPLLFLAACAVQPPATPPGSDAVVVAPAAADAVHADSAEPGAPIEEITALRAWVEQQNRLYAVSAPLLIDNTALCKNHARYLLGLTAKTKYSYSNDFIAAAQSAFGLDETLRVMNVLPGSGAERSGVRQGDILAAVEGKPMPQGRNAERDAASIIGSAMEGRTNLKLTVMRGGERVAIDVPLTQACAFGIELGNADYVNSYADGQRAMITRGMLNFTQSDEELAYVLAKEIAHNVLARSARPRMAAVIDSLRPAGTGMTNPVGTAGIKPYSPVLDATADKLALYMLVRAGYSIDNALPFWKRLASRYPATVKNSHTAVHPSTAYRFSVMTEVLKTIKAKQAHHWPLVP